ncbi:hypothetical protein [Lysobacter enzymogenes]|nr:hypothetical protein [Lysobacter enzymogenes]
MPDRPPLVPGAPAAGEPPSTWAGAFAALPAETPPADGWTRLAARLPAASAATSAEFVAPSSAARRSAAPRAAATPLRRWALAAMLAAALPLGLWLSLRAQRPDAEPAAPVVAAQSHAAPTPQRDPAPADGGRSARNEAVAATDIGPSVSAPSTAAPSIKDSSASDPTTASADREGQTRVATTAPKPNDATMPVAAATQHTTTRTRPADAAAASTATAADTRLAAQLRELQAESAQLEALVAVARDERVASAAAAVMGAGLDQRLQLIDTALGDAALPAATRVALWRERVDSLRSLAGMESTQRWYAARGERYDSALVRVD